MGHVIDMFMVTDSAELPVIVSISLLVGMIVLPIIASNYLSSCLIVIVLPCLSFHSVRVGIRYQLPIP